MLRKLWKYVVIFFTLATVAAPAAGENEMPVDVAIVLAADISFSVGLDELDLQRRGYIDAFRSDEVIAAITSGFLGRIAITYVEWGGPSKQKVIIPWTIINDRSSSLAVADVLESSALNRSDETSISAALDHARILFSTAPDATRHVIDLSSDGYNNSGENVIHARNRAMLNGITINGLPITTADAPDLDLYFRDCVIGGTGAFLYSIFQPEDFAPALKHKLVLEIAGRPNPLLQLVNVPVPIDCGIGEQQWRDEYNKQLDDIMDGNTDRWRLD